MSSGCKFCLRCLSKHAANHCSIEPSQLWTYLKHKNKIDQFHQMELQKNSYHKYTLKTTYYREFFNCLKVKEIKSLYFESWEESGKGKNGSETKRQISDFVQRTLVSVAWPPPIVIFDLSRFACTGFLSPWLHAGTAGDGKRRENCPL